MNNNNNDATVYTACEECGHEAEFHGHVDKTDDTAHFTCPNCHQTFVLGTYDGWSNFFDDGEEDDTSTPNVQSYEDWESYFVPVSPEHGGLVHEKNSEFVQRMLDRSRERVWTWIVEDGTDFIVNGFHTVNAMGYIVTTFQHEGPNHMVVPFPKAPDHNLRFGFTMEVLVGVRYSTTIWARNKQEAVARAVNATADDLDLFWQEEEVDRVIWVNGEVVA